MTIIVKPPRLSWALNITIYDNIDYCPSLLMMEGAGVKCARL